MPAAELATLVASVLGSIALLIAGLRYIIKLENIPIVSRLDKMESQLELALAKGVRNGNAYPDWIVPLDDPMRKIGWEDGEEDN